MVTIESIYNSAIKSMKDIESNHSLGKNKDKVAAWKKLYKLCNNKKKGK